MYGIEGAILGATLFTIASAYIWLICHGRARLYREIEKFARVRAIAWEGYDRAKHEAKRREYPDTGKEVRLV